MSTDTTSVRAAMELLTQALTETQQPQSIEPEIPASEFDGLPAFVAVPKVAKLLGISRASAYRYAASGELPAKRVGGRVLVVRDQLRAWMEAA